MCCNVFWCFFRLPHLRPSHCFLCCITSYDHYENWWLTFPTGFNRIKRNVRVNVEGFTVLQIVRRPPRCYTTLRDNCIMSVLQPPSSVESIGCDTTSKARYAYYLNCVPWNRSDVRLPVGTAFGAVGLPVLLLVILAAVSCDVTLSTPLAGRTPAYGTRSHYHLVSFERFSGRLKYIIRN